MRLLFLISPVSCSWLNAVVVYGHQSCLYNIFLSYKLGMSLRGHELRN